MDKFNPKLIIKGVKEDANLFLFNNHNAGLKEMGLVNSLCKVMEDFVDDTKQ